MGSEQPDSGRRWIHTSGDHPKVISRKTLIDLTMLLKGPPATPPERHAASPESDGTLTLSLAEFPELRDVGGIARVECDNTSLAIARIGRTSFAAYRPAETPSGLEELAVDYEEEDGVLRIRP
jgi:hypothetical protein